MSNTNNKMSYKIVDGGSRQTTDKQKEIFALVRGKEISNRLKNRKIYKNQICKVSTYEFDCFKNGTHQYRSRRYNLTLRDGGSAVVNLHTNAKKLT